MLLDITSYLWSQHRDPVNVLKQVDMYLLLAALDAGLSSWGRHTGLFRLAGLHSRWQMDRPTAYRMSIGEKRHAQYMNRVETSPSRRSGEEP